MGCDTGQEGRGGGGRQLVKERAVLWDVTLVRKERVEAVVSW